VGQDTIKGQQKKKEDRIMAGEVRAVGRILEYQTPYCIPKGLVIDSKVFGVKKRKIIVLSNTNIGKTNKI
jgi:uncharacterized protein (DUF934 family)